MFCDSICGCGAGDSGCSVCGVCRTCAGEGVENNEDVDMEKVAAAAAAAAAAAGLDPDAAGMAAREGGSILDILAKARGENIPLDLFIGQFFLIQDRIIVSLFAYW